MAKPKSKMTQAELRAFRSQVAKLKAAGLTKVDARSQRPTKYMKAQLRKFSGVLSGTEQVVKVPRGKGKAFGEKFERKGDKVVVPKSNLGGRAHYQKSTGDIVSTAKVPGGTVTTSYKRYDMAGLKALEGKGVSFSVSINRGTWNEVWRKLTVAELASVFEDGSFRNFSNWARYVNVERYKGNIETEAPTYEKASRPRRKGKRR